MGNKSSKQGRGSKLSRPASYRSGGSGGAGGGGGGGGGAGGSFRASAERASRMNLMGNDRGAGNSVGARVLGVTIYGSEADLLQRTSVLGGSGSFKNGDEDGDEEDDEEDDEGRQSFAPAAHTVHGHARDPSASFLPTDQLALAAAGGHGSAVMGTVPLFLLDGTRWALRYAVGKDRFRHAMLRTRMQHGLQHDGAFFIFVVKNGLVAGDCIATDEEALVSEHLAPQHWSREMQKQDFLFAGSGREHRQKSQHLVLRRRVYVPDSAETREVLTAKDSSSCALTLAFLDAAFNFRRGFLHTNRAELVEGSALLYNACHLQHAALAAGGAGEEQAQTPAANHPGDFDRTLCCAEVLPTLFLSDHVTKDVRDELLLDIQKMWLSGVNKLTEFQSERVLCHKLSGWIRWYGSILFKCRCNGGGDDDDDDDDDGGLRQGSSLTPIQYMAVATRGIFVLKRGEALERSMEVVQHFPWNKVAGWESARASRGADELVLTIAREGGAAETVRFDMTRDAAFSAIDQMIEYSHLVQIGAGGGGSMNRTTEIDLGDSSEEQGEDEEEQAGAHKKSVKNTGPEYMERMQAHFERTGEDMSNSGFLSRREAEV